MDGCLKVLEKIIGKKSSLDFELKDNEGESVYQIPQHINALMNRHQNRITLSKAVLYIRFEYSKSDVTKPMRRKII